MTIRNIKKLILTAMAIAFISCLFSITANYWSASSVDASVVRSDSNNVTTSTSCQNSSELPWLQTNGKWVEDEAGDRVTLRGISFCGFNNAWGEKALPDFAQKIAKVTNGNNGWYPNLLRLPIKD
ncbi:MAG: hypothetical protein AAGE96_06265 [Cyanobacteria bacterium P01_G01_bin.19]